MKKISVLLSTIIFMCLLAANTYAHDVGETITTDITYFVDGSYCITTVTEYKKTDYNNAMPTRATTSGSKQKEYYNSNHVLQYTVAVYGTFTYDGYSASATSSQYGYSISNSIWSFVSGNAYCSGANATASCTFHSPNAGTKTASVTLTCSASGTLS
jgi:hypothetical protein